MQVAELERVQKTAKSKPTVLFVDDEKRVLNSMRAMFRRDYTLFLTTRGDEALKIISEHAIDVVVADQRMPIMTGVELLSAVKKQSPDTVRILLTGYADLEAIEGAMNDGEVFRFLSKPCAAEELRGTIKLATEIADETAGIGEGDDTDNDNLFELADSQPNSSAPRNSLVYASIDSAIDEAISFEGTMVLNEAPDLSLVEPETVVSDVSASGVKSTSYHETQAPDRTVDENAAAEKNRQQGVEIIMTGDRHEVVDNAAPEDHAATAIIEPAPLLAGPEEGSSNKAGRSIDVKLVGTGKYKISVMVFTADELFAKSIGRSLQDYFYTFQASNIAHLMHGITKVAPAVLITDVSQDAEVIQQLTAQLKQKVPEMVTMVASQHRDAELMVKLINHGQVFRIVDKPLSSTACKRHVRAAIKKHIQLRKNPELIQRHQVKGAGEGSKLPASIGRLLNGIGRVRSLWGKKPD